MKKYVSAEGNIHTDSLHSTRQRRSLRRTRSKALTTPRAAYSARYRILRVGVCMTEASITGPATVSGRRIHPFLALHEFERVKVASRITVCPRSAMLFVPPPPPCRVSGKTTLALGSILRAPRARGSYHNPQTTTVTHRLCSFSLWYSNGLGRITLSTSGHVLTASDRLRRYGYQLFNNVKPAAF